MYRPVHNLTTSLLAALLSVAPGLQAQNPVPYQAVYNARSAGLSATAEGALEALPDGEFRLSQQMELRVLGARLGAAEETSVFKIHDGYPVPLSYSYRRTGISRSQESVSFDWDSLQADSIEDGESWVLELTPGIVDKLSFQLVLRQRFAQPDVQETTVDMVDTDEIETHLYRITGTEVIETGLGNLDTVRVERIRDADSRRHTTFWFAPDWDNLLVRFLQTGDGDADSELLLREATVGGQPVRALP